MVGNIRLKQEEISKRLANLPPQKRSAFLALLRREGIDPLRLPILPAERQTATFPLSWPQELLWFMDQLEGPSATYNAQLPLRVKGTLQVDALQQTLDAIVRRHEILRTTFEEIDGRPVQRVHDQGHWPLQVENWQGSAAEPDAILEAKIQSFARQQAETPFDLTALPLVRASLVQLSPNQAVLLLDIHHIIWDAWSIGIFGQEFERFYRAYCQGQAPTLEPLSIQYADYSLWQRQWLQGDAIKDQLSYWQQQLAQAPALLELPTDHPRPPIQQFKGGTHTVTLPSTLSEQIKALAQRQRVTVFMVLLTAFKVLLYRYSGQSDITVGTPIANRQRAELEPLIGFFVNTLALRTRINPGDSVLDLLQQVRRLTLEAYAHQDVPFEQVVEALQPERSLAHAPLFQVMLVLQTAPVPPLELPDVDLTLLQTDISTAKFDLTLELEDAGQSLVGHWLYNTDLFEATTIERMAAHFESLLAAVVEDDSQPVGTLPLLTQVEQTQLLQGGHALLTPLPTACLHQLFESQVALTPDAIAVTFEQQHLTYQELNARANQLAHYLRDLSVGAEVLVGLCIERSLEMIIGILGILKAGGAYVPLDPSNPPQRLQFMLQDAQVPVIVTQTPLLATLPDSAVQTVCLDRDWSSIAQAPVHNPRSETTADNLAYVIYTSGSTGKPKGTLIPHRNVVSLLRATQTLYNFNDQDCWTLFHSYAFDFSVWEIWGALLQGGRLVVVPYWVSRSPQEFYDLLVEQKITVLNQTPSAFRELIQVDGQAPLDALSQLRYVIFGGEALQAQSLLPWFERRGDEHPQLVNMYGITETTVHATYQPLSKATLQAAGRSVGKALANLQVYILDRHLQPVPIGVPGELYLSGLGLARGYLHRAGLTAEKFIANPFGEGRLYKSGDRARYRPGGDIEFLGRIDYQIKIRGFRIELGEIERVLVSHAQVQQCVVIVREDIPDHQQLVAYVVSSADLAQESLKVHLRAQLPDYMVPGVIMPLATLPMTLNGKVDRKALPAPERVSRSTKFQAPQTDLEKTLAAIWQDLLRLEQVSIQDNFFELGGDSILSIQMIAQARKAGLSLSPKQLFQHQTIAALATSVEQGTPVPILAQQGTVMGAVPLTPIQQWFLAQNWSNPHHYNPAVLLQVPPDLDVDALRQSLHHLAMHHDALRLRFIQQAGHWQQFHAEAVGELLPIEVIDLSHLPAAEQPTTLTEITNQQQATLHLSSGPTGRVVLFQLGHQQPQRLLFVLHHLVVDGVSWRILLSDLADLYRQTLASSPLQLLPKTTAFQDWAFRLQTYAQSGALQDSLQYWLRRPWSAVHPLPTDCAEPTDSSIAAMEQITVSLSTAATKQLLKQVPAAYNTHVNDALLTTLVRVIGPWSGSSTVLIHVEGHGREPLFEDIDVSRTVGWFTTIYPVLLTVSADASMATAIKTVKEQLREIPQKGISYGLLRYLSESPETKPALGDLPTPKISFNYLGQIEQGLGETLGWSLAAESAGRVHSPDGRPTHQLDINAQVVSGELQVVWAYSGAYYRPETIQHLAQGYIKTLQALIDHCLSPDAGGYTPSDFPIAQMTQTELDEVIQQLDL